MTELPEASGEGPTWARVPRGEEPLRGRVAALLDGVPVSTATTLMVAVYQLAIGREGARSLGGRTLAPRVSGQSICVWSVAAGETDLLRADITVRVAPPRGTRTDPNVATVAFVWAGRRVLAAGAPREVDREWVAHGAPAVSTVDHQGASIGAAAANGQLLSELVGLVLADAETKRAGGWSDLHLKDTWLSEFAAAELWLSAPMPEGHRMAEVRFDDPALTVKLLIEAAEDATAALIPRVLELGVAWQEPLRVVEPIEVPVGLPEPIRADSSTKQELSRDRPRSAAGSVEGLPTPIASSPAATARPTAPCRKTRLATRLALVVSAALLVAAIALALLLLGR